MAPVIIKSLSRLPRDIILDLCLRWTHPENSNPYLSSNRNLLECDEEDYLHEPAENISALRKLYTGLKQQDIENVSEVSKRDIIDRIVDGDWRRGLSLQQLADIDFAALESNDTALRWSALKLTPLQPSSQENEQTSHPAKKRKITYSKPTQTHYPTISPANFVTNLKTHISPLVKAHYSLRRLPAPSNLVVLRLYLVPNTPFAPLSSNVPRNVRQATDSGRVMYIALPDSCPYIYVSLSGSTGSTIASKSKDGGTAAAATIDIAATKRVILESIPKALSKPQERWSLENTKLTCRSLKAIGLLRGNNRPGTAGGCYSQFSEEYAWKPPSQARKTAKKLDEEDTTEQQSTNSAPTPLTIPQPLLPDCKSPPSSHESQVSTRFGGMTSKTHAKLDRFHVTLSDLLDPAKNTLKDDNLHRTLDSAPLLQPKKKRKRLSLEDIEAGRNAPLPSPAKSTTPIPASSLASKREPAPITLCFSGSDVFRGLKELALIDGGKFVDLSRLPSWATGEKGVSGLVV